MQVAQDIPTLVLETATKFFQSFGMVWLKEQTKKLGIRYIRPPYWNKQIEKTIFTRKTKQLQKMS